MGGGGGERERESQRESECKTVPSPSAQHVFHFNTHAEESTKRTLVKANNRCRNTSVTAPSIFALITSLTISQKREREALAAAPGRLSKPCLGGFGAQRKIISHSDTHTRKHSIDTHGLDAHMLTHNCAHTHPCLIQTPHYLDTHRHSVLGEQTHTPDQRSSGIVVYSCIAITHSGTPEGAREDRRRERGGGGGAELSPSLLSGAEREVRSQRINSWGNTSSQRSE